MLAARYYKSFFLFTMTIKITIGNQEWCSFPDLGIPAIKARIDSGAKTSSLHAFNIRGFERNSENWVSFDLHPIQNNRKIVINCEAKSVDKRMVKSSSGVAETRHVIQVPIKLGDNTWDVELTLANRDSMGLRMLLGREAMQNRVLVDPSIDHALGDHNDQKIEELYSHIENNKSVSHTGLKIGLLASNPDLYSNQRLLETGQNRGHEMMFLNIKQCYMKLDASEPQVHYRGGELLDDLDAAITRIRPNISFYATTLTRQFENMGIFTSNNSTAISQSRDKLFALQLMLKSGVNIPTTGFANSPVDTKDLIDMVGGAPLLMKLLEGNQGRGFVLAETQEAAESVINAYKSLPENLLVQKYIKEANGQDIRCFVINGKVIASILRTSAPNEFTTDINLGARAEKIKTTKEERALAKKVTKVLGLNIAGVDIIRSDSGPLLLDVTATPELEIIESVSGEDIASKIIESIEQKLAWSFTS